MNENYLIYFMPDICRHIDSSKDFHSLSDSEAVRQAVKAIHDYGTISTRRGDVYTREFITLDIETTAVNLENPMEEFNKWDFERGRKPYISYVYCIQAMIGNQYFFTRNPEDIKILLDASMTEKYLIPVFIHFAKYEFNNLLEWLRPYVDISQFHLFIDSNYPIKLKLANCELRCSYAMTNLSLAVWTGEVSKEFKNERIGKASGELDYHKFRDRSTAMNTDEMEYCFRDVYGLRYCIISECIKWSDHAMHMREVMTGEKAKRCHFKFPCDLKLTATGNVRGYIKNYWSNTPNGKNMLRKCSLNDAEYELLRTAFRGGDVQASYEVLGETVYDLGHKDFASAYPAEMVCQLFPCGAWHRTENKRFIKRLMKYPGVLYVMRVKFKAVNLKTGALPYLSESKCKFPENVGKLVSGVDIRNCKFNGRVVIADELETVMIDCDFRVFEKCYEYSDFEILEFMYQDGKRLPVPIVKLLMEFYRDKTLLKGVELMESVYMASKQLLNAIYGCSAMALDRNELEYNENTGLTYSKGTKRMQQTVMPYQWAPWVTGYVREHLNYFKQELTADQCFYSDTDSIFHKKSDAFDRIIKEYNAGCVEKLKEVAAYIKVPESYMFPVTKKGIVQVLGAFDSEDDCDRFITLGAKRYVTQSGDIINGTIAGLSNCKWNRAAGTVGESIKYIADLAEGDIFKALEMIAAGKSVQIPAEVSGKKITYIHRGAVDFALNGRGYHVESSIAMTSIPTVFSMERSLLQFFQGVGHAGIMYREDN